MFIAQPEYEENREYYENLPQGQRGIVIAEKEFSLDSGSRLVRRIKLLAASPVPALEYGRWQ